MDGGAEERRAAAAAARRKTRVVTGGIGRKTSNRTRTLVARREE